MPDTYELKYCERCGSLRLRRSKSTENYCEPCERMLLNYSLPVLLRRQAAVRKPDDDAPVPLTLDVKASFSMGRLQ